jgi:hypothetical protein
MMTRKWHESSQIISTALNTKTSLLHNREFIDSHQNHPKSFIEIRCIKSICDDREAMV